MTTTKARPKAYVLAHLGLNCERETMRALEIAGARVELLSLFELKKNPRQLLQAQMLAIPGGFSFGDEVATGLLAAQYIFAHAKEEWFQFLEKNPPIIGICNGFQILCHLNAFNHDQSETVKTISPVSEWVLTNNTSEVFSSEWKELKVAEVDSLWLKGLSSAENFVLPVRHKSGRLQKIKNDNVTHQAKIALTYNEDWNGSTSQAAGIINHSGNILGLMPHPEGAILNWQLPEKYQQQRPFGLQLLKNSVESL